MTFLDILKKYKYPLAAILVANLILLRLSYWEYGKIKITFFHVLVGVLPVVNLITKIVKERRAEKGVE